MQTKLLVLLLIALPIASMTPLFGLGGMVVSLSARYGVLSLDTPVIVADIAIIFIALLPIAIALRATERFA